MRFECSALAPLRQQHACLFTPRTDTIFAQQDHLGILSLVIDCNKLEACKERKSKLERRYDTGG